MVWKKLPKTKVAALLGVHRNTIRLMVDRGELSGLTFPDVLLYAKKQAMEAGREEVRSAVKAVCDRAGA